MSVKDLFKQTVRKTLANTALSGTAADAESAGYIEAAIEQQEKIIPIVDFSSPENFCFYGSAEKYYRDCCSRIQTQFPYDGSLSEKQQFFNSSSFLDQYIFENEYPRTTGYARLCADGWGTAGAGSSTHGLVQPTTEEYIKVFGSMNVAAADYYGQSNVYSSGSNRTANLKIDGRTGNTVEFWLKRGAAAADPSYREVLFDVWNQEAVSVVAGNPYGRMTLVMGHDVHAGVSETVCDLFVQYASGSSDCSFNTAGNPIGALICDETWRHYAVTFQNGAAGALNVKYYVDGELSSSTDFAGCSMNEVTGSLKAYIGAVQTSLDAVEAAGVPAQSGWGKFSGSIDEFRFWRKARTEKEISRNWFTQVNNYGGGGSNTEDSNVDLGLYYKFNEGITTSASYDSKVLDYSGRVSNGSWVGYTAGHRATGSALVDRSLQEYEDPIIYSFHPDVVNYIDQKSLTSSYYDGQNVAALQNQVPNWVLDEESPDGGDGHLKNLLQIMASYFDSLYLQIKHLPKLTEARYISGSMSTLPIAHRLLDSCGMVVPEIFANASVMEQFLNQDEYRSYENKLSDVKNLIYQNIYNNLNFIFKSKGTEKSFRNLLRCYGIDDELVRLNLYANNLEYEIKDNNRITSYKKRVIDFNDPDRFSATVYQYPSDGNTNSVSYISASSFLQQYEASGSAMTFEGEFIFPKKIGEIQENYFETPFSCSSLFGCHTAKSASWWDTDTSWNSPDASNFQVYAVKDQINSSCAYFKLTGSRYGHFPLLTSSLFYNVYDNEKWNLAVKIAPQKYGFANYVSGAHSSSYTVEFSGINAVAGQVRNEFSVSSSISSFHGNEFLTGSKRLYAGAHRTNFSGGVLEKTDVRLSSISCWYDCLSYEDLLAHAKDSSNYGVTHPYQSAFLNIEPSRGIFVPKIDTRILHWDFSNVTGSNAAGRFVVEDISSGSLTGSSHYGWFTNLVEAQHTARGDGFLGSDTQCVDAEFILNAKQISPGTINSSDMIQILSQDDTLFTKDTRPISFYAVYEKSMYQTISEEMVNMFAAVVDFNNLIGAPVNYYRQDYKEIEKLRALFFDKIGNTPDLEKYLEYYKWIDNSLSVFLKQLIPASADISEDVETVVESHVLERNKLWHRAPTIERKQQTITARIECSQRMSYAWRDNHRPVTEDATQLTVNQNESPVYWKVSAERDTAPLATGPDAAPAEGPMTDARAISTYRKRTCGIDDPASFRLYLKSLGYSDYDLATHTDEQLVRMEQQRMAMKPKFYQTADGFLHQCDDAYFAGLSNSPVNSYHGGINFEKSKKSDYYKDTIKFNSGISNKSIIASGSNYDVVFETSKKEVKNVKLKQLVSHRVIGERIDGEANVVMPFQIFSSSITMGSNEAVASGFRMGVEINHLHSDGYGTDDTVPMQGPFTEKWVGGKQHRHYHSIGGTILTRPEAFKIYPGSSCLTICGPDTIGSDGAFNSSVPRATFYREECAKRPVNFKNILSGNYRYDYEIVSTSGRIYNNKALIASGGFNFSYTNSTLIYSASDYAKPNRGNSKHIIVERFSAPGDSLTMGDSNGGPGLDAESAEYSAYNCLNWRNLSVRDPLNVLYTRPCGRFGTDFVSGTVYSNVYETSASFHKVNNNSWDRIQYNNSYTAAVTSSKVYDNWFIQHPIPQDDAGFTWIMACSAASGSIGA